MNEILLLSEKYNFRSCFFIVQISQPEYRCKRHLTEFDENHQTNSLVTSKLIKGTLCKQYRKDLSCEDGLKTSTTDIYSLFENLSFLGRQGLGTLICVYWFYIVGACGAAAPFVLNDPSPSQ